jgi:hypothetical protein
MRSGVGAENERRSVLRAKQRQLPIENAAPAGLVDEALIERPGQEIAGLLRHLELRGQRRRRGDPRDPETGSERFREAAQVNDTAVPVVGLDRPHVGLGRRVLEVQLAVRVILDDQHIAAFGPVEQAPPLVEADEQARRILEVGDDVEKLDAASVAAEPLEGRVERLEIDAVGVLRDSHEIGLQVAEGRDRTHVGRQLDENHVAGIDQHARDEIEPLLRAGRDEQILQRRRDPAVRHDRADHVEQRAVTACRAVLEDAGLAAGQELPGDLGEFRPRKGVGRRISRRERDDVAAAGQHRSHAADRRLLHAFGGCRKEPLVIRGHARRMSGMSAGRPAAPSVPGACWPGAE